LEYQRKLLLHRLHRVRILQLMFTTFRESRSIPNFILNDVVCSLHSPLLASLPCVRVSYQHVLGILVPWP
jgi:hypothetical protein